jgi:hypothetical protein
MELRLSKLVDYLMGTADIRNLDELNPAELTMKTPGTGALVTVIVGYHEPYLERLPLNVNWVDANPVSPTYRRVLKRKSKIFNPATPQWHHTWEVIDELTEFYFPEQYYAPGDDPNGEMLRQLLEHVSIDSGNPHGTTAKMVGALPLSGGSLTGPLKLAVDPIHELEAATKQYVDAWFAGVDGRIKTTEKAVVDFSLKIDGFTTSITDMTELVTGMSETVATVTEFYDGFTTALNDIQTQITQLTDMIPRKFTFRKSLAEKAVVWLITHNRKSVDFLWSIADEDGVPILPDDIRPLSPDQIRVAFNAPTAGSANFLFI